MIALLRQRLRRDGRQLLLWIVGTGLLALLTHVGVTGAYGTERDRAGILATVMANPVILLFRGLPSGAEEGAFTLFLILPFLAMMAAFMSSFLAVRHTRGDEEAGRAELVASTPAGRATALSATVVHGLLANAALAVVVALAFQAVGLGAGGSWSAGLASGAVGVSFLGVGLIGAQVMSTSRGANSFGVWMLMATFLLAGIGNAMGTPSADLQRLESAWPAWLSPFGWAENSRPFADDDLRPLLLCVALGLVLTGAAFALQAARDLGGGLVPERHGRADASASLSSSAALLHRLTRPAVIGWAVGGLVTGLLATTLSGALQQSAEGIPSLQAIVDQLAQGGSLAQGAVVAFFTMLGVLAACCAVQIMVHARQEEAQGTVEPLLATPVGRVRWLADHLLAGFAGIVVVIAAAVVGAALGLAGVADADWSLLSDAAVVGAGQIAAASVFLVLTALVFVVAPRVTIALGWTLVLLGLVLGLFGALFGFPDWLVRLSPIAASPTVTGDGVAVQGLWWLVAVVAAGAAGALALMRRRELAAG